MDTPSTRAMLIILPKKGILQQCQNYRTINLTSHPSRVIMKIIFNRLHSRGWRRDDCWRTGVRNRKKYYWANIQSYNSGRETPLTPAIFLLCLHRQQERLRQGRAWSLMGRPWGHTLMPIWSVPLSDCMIVTSAALFNGTVGKWLHGDKDVFWHQHSSTSPSN